MTSRPVDLAQKLKAVDQQWSPEVVARLDDFEVKVVKVQGEFVWHTHESDEMFLILATVEHCPHFEAHAVIIERAGTVNTGSAGGVLTAAADTSLLDP